MELRDDAFTQVQDGVKEGGKKAADNEANRETREKVTPVLQAFKNAAPQFQELPAGWEKGMVAAPVDFQSMFPVEDKKWDFYQDHADQAEDLVPNLRMNSPTERLAKAVAVTARKNPMAAGRLILGWRRAQIAAKGINPDTGVNVIEERATVQALIDEKYEKDLQAAQQKQREQDEEHAQHVQKQTSDFGKAEAAHVLVGAQQQAALEQNVTKIQAEFNKAQEKKAVAGKEAAKEGAQVKPVAQEKAPPPRARCSLHAIDIDANTSLKICLGYLLPIMAHSFSEVRQAAAAHGVAGYTLKRGSANYNQEPLKADVEGMKGWAEFDRQYNPSLIGPEAQKK